MNAPTEAATTTTTTSLRSVVDPGSDDEAVALLRRGRSDESDSEHSEQSSSSSSDDDEQREALEGGEAHKEAEALRSFYLAQNALPWWRRRRDPMAYSLVTKPPWCEIIRALVFLTIGALLVSLGCTISTGLFGRSLILLC